MLLFLFMSLTLAGGIVISNSWWWKSSVNVQLNFSFNLISVLFSITVILVSLGVFLFSTFYIRHSKSLDLFEVWVSLFVIRIVILLARDSWWLIFIGWEGLGLTSFWLVAFYTRWVAHNGALLTFLTNRLGDCCLLVSGVYWLWGQNFVFLTRFNIIIWVLLIIGLMTKRAQFPFVRWLPAAIAAPTPVSALVHSRTLVTAGLYLLIKFRWGKFLFSRLRWLIGGLTLVAGSWAALLDYDLKKVVAFSTLRQLGFLFLLFARMNLTVVLIHLVAHAFFKSSLFICVGLAIAMCYSNQSAHLFSTFLIVGITHFSWLVLSLMNLISLPFVRGFYSKEGGVLRILTGLSFFTFRLVLIALRYTFAYSWRLLVTLRGLRLLMFSGKSIFNFKISTAVLTSFTLWGLGYVWAKNILMASFNRIYWQFFLTMLGLLSFWSIILGINYVFYSITRGLKISLRFYLVSIFHQINHVLRLKIFSRVRLSWSLWVAIARTVIIFLL